jgi:hypothetical protein
MPAVTRGWPPSRRRAQAQNIRKTQPWRRATGPKTSAGKARIRTNALKHGGRARCWRDFRSALTHYARWLKRLRAPVQPSPNIDIILRPPYSRGHDDL